MSNLSNAEKAVFGVKAFKDDTGQIIESGVGFVKQFVEGVEAAFDAGPLIDQRDALLTENAALKAQITGLAADAAALHAEIDRLTKAATPPVPAVPAAQEPVKAVDTATATVVPAPVAEVAKA